MKRKTGLVTALAMALILTMGTFTVYASTWDKTDFNGDWTFTLYPPSLGNLAPLSTDINGSPTYTLTQDGDKLIGTGKGKYGDFNAQGIITGNTFKMTGTMGKSAISLDGLYEDGRIIGKVVIPFADGKFFMKRK